MKWHTQVLTHLLGALLSRSEYYPVDAQGVGSHVRGERRQPELEDTVLCRYLRRAVIHAARCSRALGASPPPQQLRSPLAITALSMNCFQ